MMAPNRLAAEKSPYLRQHAENPVDWYPWGREAFRAAGERDRPVFLSIGYSTCHWCHVMARESFEDPQVARLMNDAFICVKVDREERPDIDGLYMTACRLLTGSGGWPLTVVMTPDQRPFFAGTYIPRESRSGRVGMLELIPRIKDLWATQRNQVLASARGVTEALCLEFSSSGGTSLNREDLTAAFKELAGRFDREHGGFGAPPKFPSPQNLFFLLRFWKRTGHPEALHMAEKTLQAMRGGGLYDHLGFGFHRYSTDAEWRTPHFEKMLCDQALLASAYMEAYQATGRETYGRTAREVLEYALTALRSPAGGFYSAEDADSDGEEGKYYLWTPEEIRKALGPAEADTALSTLCAGKMEPAEGEARRLWNSSREKLMEIRSKRARPFRDDKILADWNGLMIAALAMGGRLFDAPGYSAAAKGAADFILKNMRTRDNRLYHRYRDGEAAVEGNLSDYAFLVHGLLALYESIFDAGLLKAAMALNRAMSDHFWDERNKGFFFTPDDGEGLLIRQKEIHDGAVPSGNAVAVWNLLKLSRITGDAKWEQQAGAALDAFAGDIRDSPVSCMYWMPVLDYAMGPSYQVVIAGRQGASDTREMLRALQGRFLPGRTVLFRDTGNADDAIIGIAPYSKSMSFIGGKAAAYVCSDFRCSLPTTETGKMLEQLG